MKTQDADQNGGLGHKNASVAGIRGCVAIKCSADDVNVPEDVIILVPDPEPRAADPGPILRSIADFSIANLPFLCHHVVQLQFHLYFQLLPQPGIGPFPLLLISGCWGKQQIIKQYKEN